VAFAVGVTLCTLTLLHCGWSSHEVTAGFWFDHVTFELPERETERIGGSLREDEAGRIRSIAWVELHRAYSGLRLSFAHRRDGFYRVAVLQELEGRPFGKRMVYGDAGQSRTFGLLGGSGAVSFAILARNAIHYAPPGATRAEIVDAIGRGIGRAAAHEFAHQIVPGVNLHQTGDKESYEYGTADRAAQYYGVLHWSVVRPALVRRLGRG
jgi:hypothetical protein